MQGDLLSFGDGLIAILHAPESDEAIAAASIVGGILLLHQSWLESHREK